jgi:hypothetical protein
MIAFTTTYEDAIMANPATAHTKIVLPLSMRFDSPNEVIQRKPPYTNMSNAKEPTIDKIALMMLAIITRGSVVPNGFTNLSKTAGLDEVELEVDCAQVTVGTNIAMPINMVPMINDLMNTDIAIKQIDIKAR